MKPQRWGPEQYRDLQPGRGDPLTTMATQGRPTTAPGPETVSIATGYYG